MIQVHRHIVSRPSAAGKQNGGSGGKVSKHFRAWIANAGFGSKAVLGYAGWMLKYQITTPEQVVFHYTMAGPFARCMAWLVDEAIIWAGYLALFMMLVTILRAFQDSPGGIGDTVQSIGLIILILGMFVLDFCYFVYFELRWAGQSPGKRCFGIRVISARGTRLRFADVLLRNLMRPIDMLPFAMAVGGTVCFIDRWHRRLGEHGRRHHHHPPDQPGAAPAMAAEKSRVNSFQTDPVLRSRILRGWIGPRRDLILDLAIRRDQIDPDARQRGLPARPHISAPASVSPPTSIICPTSKPY